MLRRSLDEPRLERFLARLDGRPVAIAGVLALGQIGVIDPCYVSPPLRGQRIGPTLMAHVLEYCHRALFEQVILRRADGCPSIPFYEGLGFERLVSYTKYVHRHDDDQQQSPACRIQNAPESNDGRR
jgi:GNAT superfamily N-acetyltransferase